MCAEELLMLSIFLPADRDETKKVENEKWIIIIKHMTIIQTTELVYIPKILLCFDFTWRCFFLKVQQRKSCMRMPHIDLQMVYNNQKAGHVRAGVCLDWYGHVLGTLVGPSLILRDRDRAYLLILRSGATHSPSPPEKAWLSETRCLICITLDDDARFFPSKTSRAIAVLTIPLTPACACINYAWSVDLECCCKSCEKHASTCSAIHYQLYQPHFYNHDTFLQSYLSFWSSTLHLGFTSEMLQKITLQVPHLGDVAMYVHPNPGTRVFENLTKMDCKCCHVNWQCPDKGEKSFFFISVHSRHIGYRYPVQPL